VKARLVSICSCQYPPPGIQLGFKLYLPALGLNTKQGWNVIPVKLQRGDAEQSARAKGF
jgi:hypothetical protein